MRPPLWQTAALCGNSEIFQTGGMVGIHTTAPTATLTVIGPNASGSGLAAPTVLKVTGGVGGLGNFSMRVGRDGHLYMMAEVEWNPDADHFLPVLEVTK